MLANRYIQAVLSHDIALEIKPDAEATIDQSDRDARADQHRERAEQMSFRFVDLDRRFGI